MFKKIAMLACVTILLAGYCAIASHEDKLIVVVGDDSYAPFEFEDDQGNMQGITVDIWRLWSEKTGIEVDYRGMDWAEALLMVENGEADVVGGMFYSEERDKRFDYSSPYWEIPAYIFFHEDILGITDLEDLSGFEIGVVKSDFAEDYLKENFPQYNLVGYDGFDDLVKAAIDEEVRVFVMDAPIGKFYLSQTTEGAKYKHTSDPIYTNHLHAGVQEGDADTLNVVNAGFSQISDKDLGSIEKDWTGLSVSFAHSLRRYILILVGSAVIVVSLFVIWNVQLRKKVKISVNEVKKQRDQIEGQRSELEKQRDELEKKVKERTLEMEEKLEEVERLNEAMVGRELKMKEMKEEIAMLKKAEDKE
ncbi:transporter substrate-binding domain-containing protein [Patescibacteria group bacterium]